METNGIKCATDSDPVTSLWVILDWDRSPVMQFTILATITVCVCVVWLAVLNIKCLRRRDLSQTDLMTVDCRMAVSKYVLLFLGAVWLLLSSACLMFLVSNLTQMEPGEARDVLVQFHTQPPYVLAVILVVLTGIHSVVGILNEIRKKKNISNAQLSVGK